MDGLGDASVTIRQDGAQGPSKDAVPVLLMIGSAQKGGGLDLPRVVLLPRSLEIGRARGDTTEEPEDRLGVPDKLLSRIHLRLERVPGGCDSEDVGSLNGTFVDGRRLAGRVRLTDGNLLLFGGHAALFRRVTQAALEAIEQDLATPFGPVATS